MHNAPYSLEERLPDIKSWAVIGPQFFVTTESLSGIEETEMLTTAEVATVHPDLPEAIHGIISHNKRCGTSNYAAGVVVCNNVRLLRGELVSFVGKLGQTKLIDYPIEFDLPTEETEMLKMYAVCFIIGTVFKGTRAIPYITHSRVETHYASVANLESAYPGWQQRWEIGRELGVPHNELMRHVFTNDLSVTPIENKVLPSFE